MHKIDLISRVCEDRLSDILSANETLFFKLENNNIIKLKYCLLLAATAILLVASLR